MRDLTFKIEEGRFNLRVGAIIIHNSKVLMVKNTRDCFVQELFPKSCK